MKIRIILAMLLLFSCQIQSKRGGTESETPLVDPKYSIAQDRSALDELRQDVPADIKKENDEKALMAELTAEVKRPPTAIRA